MFYFESLKLQTSSNNTPYALTLKLNSQQVYTLISQENDWLNQLFYFTKNKDNYQYGSWLVDDYDLIHMSKNNFNNFCYHKFSFCDQDLFFNWNLTGKATLNLYTKFFQKDKKFAKKLCNLVELDEVALTKKIHNLNLVTLLKLMLVLTTLKDSDYIICNFSKYKTLTIEQTSMIESCLNKISQQYKKTIINFAFINWQGASIINLDSKECLTPNKIITISIEKYIAPGYKLWKNKLSIFWIMYYQINWEWILFFLTNTLFACTTILFLSLPNFINQNNNSNIAIFIKNNLTLWNTIGYISYVLNYLNLLVWWKVMSKKYYQYFKFLETIHINQIKSNIVWPIIYFSNAFFSVFIAFGIIDLSYKYNAIITNYLWFGFPMFLYIIYLIIFILALILKINQSLNHKNFKQTFINIISK